MKSLVKISFGLFFLGLSFLLGLLESIALLDPVGTKMADDADPFGDYYIPWHVHAFYILLTGCCLLIGFLLLKDSAESSIKS